MQSRKGLVKNAHPSTNTPNGNNQGKTTHCVDFDMDGTHMRYQGREAVIPISSGDDVRVVGHSRRKGFVVHGFRNFTNNVTEYPMLGWLVVLALLGVGVPIASFFMGDSIPDFHIPIYGLNISVSLLFRLLIFVMGLVMIQSVRESLDARKQLDAPPDQ